MHKSIQRDKSDYLVQFKTVEMNRLFMRKISRVDCCSDKMFCRFEVRDDKGSVCLVALANLPTQ